MAFHRYLIQLLWDFAPADIATETAAKPRLAIQWCVSEDGSLCWRWTQARD